MTDPKTTRITVPAQAKGVPIVQQNNYVGRLKTFGIASSRDMLTKRSLRP